jgi:tripartite-type tricarboxylate transporter receptor subunit TctC
MRILVLLAAVLLPALVQAQGFPNRTLRVVVPQPPGGGFDLVARVLAEGLANELGQSVIVENRPGGGTVIGTDAVAKAEADGYTVLLGASANLVLSAGLYKSLPYDPKADFRALGIAGVFTYTMVARSDLAQASLKEIVEFARANPGKLTYASAGNGSGQHIAAALLWHLAGVSVTHVPYKGAQAVYQDLIPGRVDLFFDASPTARVQIDGGRVRPIVVSPAARLAFHPSVPTVRETGVLDFEWETWAGYFVRSATPAPVLARLREAFGRVTASPALAAALEKRGVQPQRISGPEADALLAADLAKWTPLIRKAGIRAD